MMQKTALLCALTALSYTASAGAVLAPTNVPTLDSIGLIGLALGVGLAGAHLLRKIKNKK